MITSSQGEPSKIEKAKDKIKNSLIGLTVLLTIYILLTTINPGLIVIKDLSIQGIIENNPIAQIINHTTKPSPDNFTFQEVPIGSITENVLARNISCFDKDRNLIDCKTKKVLNGKPEDEYSSKNSILYCYIYDSQGNKSGIFENRDRFDCLTQLTNGLESKIEILKGYIVQLRYLMDTSCSCSSCQIGGWEPAISCPGGCISYCHCCGSPRGESSFFCNGPANESHPYTLYNDPCSNRAAIDSLREAIKQLVNGGDPKDMYYNWQMDPDESHKQHNTKFMTLTLYQQKITEFKNQLNIDADYLNQAKKIMRVSQAEQISLAELQKLQNEDETKSVSTTKTFGNFDIISYCSDFNCTEYNDDKTCAKMELNSEGRICKIKDGAERYLLDGDPATFYFNEDYKTIDNDKKTINLNSIGEQEVVNQCSINVDQEKGMDIGFIPIGETVDGSQKLVEQIGISLDSIVSEVANLIVPVLTSEKAIYYLPEGCKCSNCSNGMIQLSSECCAACGTPFAQARCTSAKCTTCQDISSEIRICPYATYSSKSAEVDARSLIVATAIKRVHDLIYSENLRDDDISRVKLLENLSISRDKLEGCVGGYGLPQGEGNNQTNLLSCQDGVIYTLLHQLEIGPSFPWPNKASYINCYPFNSSDLTAEEKNICLKNPTGQGKAGDIKCQDLMYNKNMMDNYYCCVQTSK
jgi:hypothetical protein